MRRSLVTSAIVAVSLALAACANAPGPGSSEDARRAVMDAFRRTADAGSARATFDLTADVQGRTIDLSGTAEYQMDPHDPTSLRERAVLQIPPLTFGATGGEVEMRVTKGPVLFVRAPMFASYLNVSTPWLKLDPSETSSAGDGSAALGSMAGLTDPAALLGMLEGSVSAEMVGVEQVDGTQATHYHVTVDVASALETFVHAMTGPEHERMAATLPTVLAKLKAAGLQELPFDVWVDGAGFLKRMRASIDLRKLQMPGPAPSVSVSITITLSDVGAPVDVQPPPADQVTDIADLMPATSTTSTTST